MATPRIAATISTTNRTETSGAAGISHRVSPGNQVGGLANIFEKSLGSSMKGGTGPLMEVYRYAEPVTAKGLVFMDTPGYDPVSATGQVELAQDMLTMRLSTRREATDANTVQNQLKVALEQALALRLIAEHFPPGTRVTRPEGGYFLWLELPPQVDALALHQRARAASISTAPGVLFSADHRFTHHLRLNVGHPGDARFDDAIKTLGRLAVALGPGPRA